MIMETAEDFASIYGELRSLINQDEDLSCGLDELLDNHLNISEEQLLTELLNGDKDLSGFDNNENNVENFEEELTKEMEECKEELNLLNNEKKEEIEEEKELKEEIEEKEEQINENENNKMTSLNQTLQIRKKTKKRSITDLSFRRSLSFLKKNDSDDLTQNKQEFSLNQLNEILNNNGGDLKNKIKETNGESNKKEKRSSIFKSFHQNSSILLKSSKSHSSTGNIFTSMEATAQAKKKNSHLFRRKKSEEKEKENEKNAEKNEREEENENEIEESEEEREIKFQQLEIASKEIIAKINQLKEDLNIKQQKEKEISVFLHSSEQENEEKSQEKSHQEIQLQLRSLSNEIAQTNMLIESLEMNVQHCEERMKKYQNFINH